MRTLLVVAALASASSSSTGEAADRRARVKPQRSSYAPTATERMLSLYRMNPWFAASEQMTRSLVHSKDPAVKQALSLTPLGWYKAAVEGAMMRAWLRTP